jgi:hypothetical protein
VQLFVVGDIHVQEEKLWTILKEAGLVDGEHRPTPLLKSEETRLVLLENMS